MSVSVLYCEGGKGSPDIKLIRRLLKNVTVEPVGGKGQLSSIMRWMRSGSISSGRYALRDRDFDDDDLCTPLGEPRRWEVKDNDKPLHLGWSWERNCIENYLVDPEVVFRACENLNFSRDTYTRELEKAAVSLSDYTAARYALSKFRIKNAILQNAWGEPCGPDPKDHFLPVRRNRDDCYLGIEKAIQGLENHPLPSSDQVKEYFDNLLPGCRKGGLRFSHFLVYFSGKDLMGAMEPFLKSHGLDSAGDFRAKVLMGLEDSGKEVWRWLPEWEALRKVCN